jgi:DnaK suppressor protein
MDSSEARELLAAERTRIESALAGLAKPEGDEEAHTDDSGDSAPELLETEIDEGLAAPLREELAALDRAEQRLADGTYGKSVESGEAIPDGRLRSIPWAERTAEEQARYEGGA